MEFRILGPLEVWSDERRVSLGGSKQRMLLALLLLHRNEVVSIDRLVEEDDPGAEDAGDQDGALDVLIWHASGA